MSIRGVEMLKQVYKIDENSYLQEILVKDFDDEGNCLEELTEDFITVDPPNGLYCARWIGSEWIEGLSQKKIDEINYQPMELTVEERLVQLETLTVNNITNQIENQIMKGDNFYG